MILHFLLCKLSYVFFSWPSLLLLKLKGVKIKDGAFAGFPYINREKGSVMEIGEKCRFMSKTVGNFIGINHRCMLTTYTPNSQLIIGNNCGFSGTSIWCFDKITIGDNVKVGANVVIMDGDAHQDDPRAGENKPVVIEDNVWIGAGVTVLKGVTIGRNSLIGAGSVVVKDVPANMVAAGNPCKPVKALTDDIINQLEKTK
jgi:acetyltransferase-like isoleucine patch superfamily enzyme